MPTKGARQPHMPQTVYLRKRILGSAGNATYIVGRVPAGANILRIHTTVGTVFSGGTPTISFGTTANGALFFAAAGGPATTVGNNLVALIATGSVAITAATDITATVAGTPTAGSLDVQVEYTLPDA
jgi:hypothetical protein